MRYSYLGDVLALKLLEEGVDALLIDVDTDGLDDSLDVSGGWAGVASEAEEEESSQVLHFDDSKYSVSRDVHKGSDACIAAPMAICSKAPRT
jgi:hypothetical protein